MIHIAIRIFLTIIFIVPIKYSVFCQNMITIHASDPNIQYSGRIDDSNPDNVMFAYPGVSIKAKFEGSQIDAVLTEYGYGGSTTTNYLNVIINGAEPTVLQLNSQQTNYTLATGLDNGVHTIELFKRTESNVGNVAFGGFKLIEGNTLLSPDALPDRKIEFIGNSITCGYGNESSANPPVSGFTSVNENNYMAWGAVAARTLEAQYSCIAYSGRGLMQNNNGTTNGVLPQIYNQVIADQPSPTWNTNRYSPDVIVINLGTNDFAAETSNSAYYVNETSFVNAYINFIDQLRSYYPCASIICCVGVMMSDYYPSGANQWTRIQSYVSSVRDHFNSQGDDKVYYLMLEPQQAPYGEDWHPTTATDQIMANTLIEFINSNVTWQSRPQAPLVTSPVIYSVNDIAEQLYATGENLKWYNESGEQLPEAPTPNTTQSDTMTFYVTQTIGDCESGQVPIDVYIQAQSSINIQLYEGWNLIGCPVGNVISVESALESIWDNLILIKDQETYYIKDENPAFNLLREFQYGYGYQIKVNADCTLLWNN